MYEEISLTKKELNIFNQYKNQINYQYKNNKNLNIEKIANIIYKKIIRDAKFFIDNINKLKNNTDALFIKKIAHFDLTDADLFSAKVLSHAISLTLGQPFQYQQQNGGEVIAEIRPSSEKSHTQSSSGKVEFGWHTDDSFLNARYRTKWILLTGVYNPDLVHTKVALVDNIIELLSQKSLSELLQKKYTVKLSDSFYNINQIYKVGIPIVKINGDNNYEISVPTYNVSPNNPNDINAVNAIQELKDVANKSKQSICLTSGSILIFNNDRILHARDSIKSDRLILRTYIKPNLFDLRKRTNENGRVFDLTKLIEVA